MRYHISTHGTSFNSDSPGSAHVGGLRAISDHPDSLQEQTDRMMARKTNERREQYRQVSETEQ